MRVVVCLMLASQAGMAQPAPDVSELVKRVGERFFALENFDVELKIGDLGDHPMERRMRMARRDDGSMLLDTKTGYVTIVRDGRLIRIRDRYKEWTETAAEGPPMRSLKRTFEPYVTRFEKLAAVDFEIEFVKWQELKRGARRVKCAVVRMWPRRQADGIWKETLWIEPDEALVWRSLMEQPPTARLKGNKGEPGGLRVAGHGGSDRRRRVRLGEVEEVQEGGSVHVQTGDGGVVAVEGGAVGKC